MDQPGFLQSRDDFHVPSSGRTHPLQKRPGIARVSQSAGGNDPHGIRSRILNGAMKPPQHLHRGSYRFGRQKTIAEHGIAQARDFAVLLNLDEPVPGKTSNFQAHGVRSDINGGKGRHGGRAIVYSRGGRCLEKISEAGGTSGNFGACPGRSDGRFAAWGSSGVNRLRFLARKGRSSFSNGIDALTELCLRHISQHGHQRRVSDPAEECFRSLCQFQPVMPVANDVLHMLELVDDALGLRVMVSQFSDVTSPLADDPVLVESPFRERDMISSELSEFAQRQSQWFGILRDINLARGALQAFSYFVRGLTIKCLSKFLFVPGALLHQSVYELRFVSVALGNLQTP